MAKAAQIARWVVGAFGLITGLSVVSVPGFTTIRAIRAAGDVGARTVFPYSTTWINALALVVYAWPKKDWEVLALNFTTLVVESFYVYSYIRNSVGWNRLIAYGMVAVQLVFTVTLVVLQLTLFADDSRKKERETTFGWIGVVTAILMYISPAKEMCVAWWNRNIEGLSLGLSLAFLGNALIWTGYSFIDPFNLYYLVANGTGIGSATLQCGVWLYCYHGQ